MVRGAPSVARLPRLVGQDSVEDAHVVLTLRRGRRGDTGGAAAGTDGQRNGVTGRGRRRGRSLGRGKRRAQRHPDERSLRFTADGTEVVLRHLQAEIEVGVGLEAGLDQLNDDVAHVLRQDGQRRDELGDIVNAGFMHSDVDDQQAVGVEIQMPKTIVRGNAAGDLEDLRLGQVDLRKALRREGQLVRVDIRDLVPGGGDEVDHFLGRHTVERGVRGPGLTAVMARHAQLVFNVGADVGRAVRAGNDAADGRIAIHVGDRGQPAGGQGAGNDGQQEQNEQLLVLHGIPPK